MSLDKKKGIMIVICLILFIGIVDAAWIFFYFNQTITGNVIGGEKPNYEILKFNGALSIDTSKGAASNSTIMRINNLDEKQEVDVKVNVNRTNLDSDCSGYDKDCDVTLTHILPNGTRNNLISHSISSNPNKESFTLLKGNNQIEYNLSCKQNSCPQTILFNITIEQD